MLVSGWHRMGYTYSDGSYISQLLVEYIQTLHDIVGNAVTEGKHIVFGSGSTQLLNAAVYALSPDTSSLSPAKVVATPPYFPVSFIQHFQQNLYVFSCHFQINIGFLSWYFKKLCCRCIEHRHNILMLGILVMKEAHPHGLTRHIVTLHSLSLLLHQTILMEIWLREFLKVIM